jgi:hypothetical protein
MSTVVTNRLTIRRMLPYNLHSPNDTRFLAIGVVEEGQVTLLHGSEVVAGGIGADTIPRLRLGPGCQIVDGESHVYALLQTGLGLGFQEPVVPLPVCRLGLVVCLLLCRRFGGLAWLRILLWFLDSRLARSDIASMGIFTGFVFVLGLGSLGDLSSAGLASFSCFAGV